MAKVNIAIPRKKRAPISRLLTALRRLAVGPFLVLACSLVFAQGYHPTESQAEAADLYNFGKFVTWPADRFAKSETFQICILGKDPFGATLDSIVAGESISGKKIRVQRLRKVQQAQTCMILFISSSEENRLAAILLRAQNFGVLTVSEVNHFAERGGDIGLVHEQDRVRFEVNRTAAEHCHLIVSSELLKVATRVVDKP